MTIFLSYFWELLLVLMQYGFWLGTPFICQYPKNSFYHLISLVSHITCFSIIQWCFEWLIDFHMRLSIYFLSTSVIESEDCCSFLYASSKLKLKWGRKICYEISCCFAFSKFWSHICFFTAIFCKIDALFVHMVQLFVTVLNASWRLQIYEIFSLFLCCAAFAIFFCWSRCTTSFGISVGYWKLPTSQRKLFL